MYGGASLNAIHALLQIALGGHRPGADGRLPGAAPRGDRARRATRSSPAGRSCSRAPRRSPEQGSRPMRRGGRRRVLRPHLGRALRRRARDRRRLARPSSRPCSPSRREANVSIRLAPGQDPVAIGGGVRAAAARGRSRGRRAEIEQQSSAPPGLVSPDAPAVSLAQDAFETALGVRPLLVRSGGSIPLVPALAGTGIPTIADRLRPARVEHPLPERAHARRVPAARRRDGARALTGASADLGCSAPLLVAARGGAGRRRPRALPPLRPDRHPVAPRAQTRTPSTAKQLDLSRLLDVGAARARARRTSELDEHGYVFATLRRGRRARPRSG